MSGTRTPRSRTGLWRSAHHAVFSHTAPSSASPSFPLPIAHAAFVVIEPRRLLRLPVRGPRGER
jgi:hypothetical protein